MYQGVNASEGIGIGKVMVAVDPDLTFEPHEVADTCLLYTSGRPRDLHRVRAQARQGGRRRNWEREALRTAARGRRGRVRRPHHGACGQDVYKRQATRPQSCSRNRKRISALHST